ncbi:hypothetical protein D3C72_1772960 [compost metagenome]
MSRLVIFRGAYFCPCDGVYMMIFCNFLFVKNLGAPVPFFGVGQIDSAPSVSVIGYTVKSKTARLSSTFIET